MSIGTDRFESQGSFMTYDRFSARLQRTAVFQLQCRRCGYEPDDVITSPRRCPKCHGQSWERYPRPGGVLHTLVAGCSSDGRSGTTELALSAALLPIRPRSKP